MDPMDNRAGSTVTPEAVVLDFELAGVASRALSYTVDFIAQALAFLALTLTAGVIGGGSSVGGIVVLLVGVISIVFGYPILMETKNQGRSLGRMVVGTRVVTVEGAPVRFRHSFARALLGIVDLLMSFGGIGVVAALLTKRGQRLGDLVGGTMVIRERASKLDATPKVFSPPLELRPWASALDTAGVTESDYRLVRDFLVRYHDFTEPTQRELAVQLADHISNRLPLHPAPQGVSAVAYLTAVASAKQGPPSAPDTWRGAQPPPPKRGSQVNPGSPVPPSPIGDSPGWPSLPDAPPLGPQPSWAPPSPIADPPPANEGGFSAPG